MNYFASDAFLAALARVSAPGRPFEIGLYETDGSIFRLVSVEGARPITSHAFFDSVRAVPAEPGARPRPLRYLPVATLSAHELSGAPEPVDLGPDRFPAPYIDWTRFATWESFEEHFVSRRGTLARDSRQKRRHLERDRGAVTFVAQDTRPDVFARCIEWKSAQYLRTGLPDMFHDPSNVELFRVLLATNALLISSLSAGGVLVAAHFGGLADDGVYSWVAAYDPAYARYSPGRLLLEDLLRECHGRGHREFDFGIGHSDYKWHYASHSRVLGPLGKPPLALALRKEAKVAAKKVLARWPALYARVRHVRQELRARGVAP